MKSLGSFNQSSQCSQHVITGSRPPRPQWEETITLLTDQLPILAVLGSLPLSHFADSAPCLQYPPIGTLLEVYYMTIATLLLPTIFTFSLLSALSFGPEVYQLPPPPDYLSSDQPSTNICYPSLSSYNDCGHHRSLPHTTSYFGSIGSHDHHVSQLASSRSPSSFDLDRSFLFQ